MPEYRPLIVQSDGSIMLDVHAPAAEEARTRISVFAELEKSPEHVHTYRLSSLSLWNAASVGVDTRDVLDTLSALSRFPVPDTITRQANEAMSR